MQTFNITKAQRTLKTELINDHGIVVSINSFFITAIVDLSMSDYELC